MQKNIRLAIVVAAASSCVGITQAQQTQPEQGESPGTIMLGPGGFWQKGPESPSRGRGGRAGLPSVAVRPADSRHIRTALTALLGWSVGAPSSAFGRVTFREAAGKVDALGLSSIEGSSANLDYNGGPDELTDAKHRLNELRLQMPAYRVTDFPAGESSRRKLF